MLPAGKTTPSAGASLVLAGNKAASASPSVVSAKQVPAGAAGGLVLAVDGKRSVATLAAVQGRGPAFSDDDHKPKGEADHGRTSLYEMVKKSSLVEPTPTVCSDDEVKAVLHKTLTLLESSDPAHSTTGMAGLFYKVRSNCRALVEDVEKNGVDGKTGSAIAMIHISALFVLGQHKKYFSYEDAADDSLVASLRRLEVALRDYKIGGPSSPPSETTN